MSCSNNRLFYNITIEIRVFYKLQVLESVHLQYENTTMEYKNTIVISCTSKKYKVQ